MTQEKFLNTLFKPDELTCFTSTPYGTSLALKPAEGDIYFSINPLHSSRSDANVIAYRNFLIELDSVPLKQQIEIVTAKVPVTSIVYSGNKSYHFIISLKEDLTTEADYRRVIRGIMEAIPEADKSTKNPSRLSRLPGVLRPDTRLVQDLIYLGSSVDIGQLPKASKIEQERPVAANKIFVSKQLTKVIEVGVDNYIAASFDGHRNRFFYWLGKRCSELGHTKEDKKKMVDKLYNLLQNKRGFSIREAYAAARVKF